MSQYFAVHPTHPQPRLIAQAAAIIRDGGVIAYPTDSCYAIGCQIGDKEAMQRLRNIRKVDDKHHLTLLCPYPFILQAGGGGPRPLLPPRRKPIGMRVPEHAVAHALRAARGEPLLSATLILPGDALPLNDAEKIRV